MGDWVHADHIQKVIDTARSLPDHRFMFMTKNPLRYKEFDFSDNCILGVTVESPAEWWRVEIMEWIPGRKMASVEPILGDFTGYYFSMFEFVVVGALWKFNDEPLDKQYYDTVKHDKIYYTR
jgi:protein gp37